MGLIDFVVEFNLKDNEFTLYPKGYSLQKIMKQDQQQWSTSTFDDLGGTGAIIFEMLANSKPVSAILDTGARHSIMNWKAAGLLGLTKTSAAVQIEETSASGLHGDAPKTAYTTILSSLSTLEKKVKSDNIKMHIADLASFNPLLGDKAGVNLGIDFFEKRKLVIDYANKVIAITL